MILSTLLIIFFATLSLFAIYFYKKQKYRWSLISVVVLGGILRIYCASDQFLHNWDERYHALVSKNLIEHPLKPTLYENPVLPYSKSNWTQNHVWLHKQPLPLWSMAFSMKIFGTNEFALRLPSMLLSIIGIILVARIGSDLFNEKAGLIAAYLFAINGLILDLGSGRWSTDHYDFQFMFYILLAIYFAMKFRRKGSLIISILIGACMGLALLTKWLPALIILPVWFIINYNTIKIRPLIFHGLLIFTTAFVIFLPWQFYSFWKFPHEAFAEFDYNLKHANTAVEGRTGGAFYHLTLMRIHYGELIYLVIILALSVLLRKKERALLAMFVWVFITYVFFSAVATKMSAYTVISAPAMFLLIGIVSANILENQWKWAQNKWLKMLMLLCFIGLPIRFSVERIAPFSPKYNSPEWAIQLKNLENEFDNNTILFNVKRNIEGMFFTDYTMYQRIPTENEVRFLRDHGYRVIVNLSEFEFPELLYFERKELVSNN